MPNLLSSIGQISPQWLQAIFEEARIAHPAMRSVRTLPIGAGNTGETVQLIIDYESDNHAAPSSVICKFHPADPTRAELLKSMGTFVLEANAQKLLAERSEAAIPKCYFVGVADDGGQFNLVCEDLSSRCELGNQIAGCSIAEARATVVELAKLHRQFWNEPTINELTWIKPRVPLPDNALELLEDRLNRWLTQEQAETVRRAAPRVYDWLQESTDNPTLIHVDCRADNVLFDNSSDGDPQAYLIDFASLAIGDATADVAYLLTSSLAPEDRLACETELLALHTAEIAKKDPNYTIEHATAAYCKNIVSSLYLTMIAAIHIPESPHTREMLTRLFERNCAAVQHWMNL